MKAAYEYFLGDEELSTSGKAWLGAMGVTNLLAVSVIISTWL